MPRLENQVAIITGAASGIGEGTVRKYVAEGARVLIADIQDERGGALAEELGPNTTYFHTDVSQEEDVAAAVSQAVSRWGRLDVMFNNAGFGGVGGQSKISTWRATTAPWPCSCAEFSSARSTPPGR